MILSCWLNELSSQLRQMHCSTHCNGDQDNEANLMLRKSGYVSGQPIGFFKPGWGYNRGGCFPSIDFWVLGQARFRCATLLRKAKVSCLLPFAWSQKTIHYLFLFQTWPTCWEAHTGWTITRNIKLNVTDRERLTEKQSETIRAHTQWQTEKVPSEPARYWDGKLIIYKKVFPVTQR